MEAKDILIQMKNLADAEDAAVREKLDRIRILNAEVAIHREHASGINKTIRGCEETIALKETVEKEKDNKDKKE